MARVLVVTNMYPPHHYGGYELANADFVDAMRARGHEVWVLTSTHRRPGVEGAPETGVHRSLSFYWDDFVLTKPGFRTRLAMERGNQRALAAVLEEAQPDVVSAWNMGAMSMGLLTALARREIPIALVIADTWLGWAADFDRWLRPFWRRPGGDVVGRLAERAFGVPSVLPPLDRAAVPLFASRWLQERAEHEAPWRFDRAAIVPWGIDERDFPVTGRAAPPWEGRLLFVGRIDERKGVDVVVRALPQLPGARLRIVGPPGDEEHRARLHALIEELGVRDRVELDSVERGAMADAYRAADVLLFPSVWAEPFGLVGLEGMACGVPVVATGTGGSGEYLVHERTCLRVEPGRADQLAEAVRRLADDEELRRGLVARGLDLARTLTVDRMVDDLEAWHLAAVERFSSGEPARRPVLADDPPPDPRPRAS